MGILPFAFYDKRGIETDNPIFGSEQREEQLKKRRFKHGECEDTNLLGTEDTLAIRGCCLTRRLYYHALKLQIPRRKQRDSSPNSIWNHVHLKDQYHAIQATTAEIQAVSHILQIQCHYKATEFRADNIHRHDSFG